MRPLRSLLFVPGDSEKKLAKARGVAADALIVDLEDAVAESRKERARAMVGEYLRAWNEGSGPQLWVRVNPLSSAQVLADLAAVVPARPAGVMVPKVDGPADVRRIGHYLDAFEAMSGVAVGTTKILPVATETPLAPFALGDYAGAGLARLYGLTWGAEDLSAAVGAAANVGPDGRWELTYQIVRSMTLLGAKAAGVEAVETLYVDIADSDGLAASCARARAEGFSGRIAIHPSQVDVINAAFTPSDAELDYARRIVDAFESNPELGTVALDGKMLDAPHLKQARRTLAFAVTS